MPVFVLDVLSKGLLGVMGIALIRFMPQDQYALYTLSASLITVATQTLAASFNRIYIVGYDALDLENEAPSFLGLQLSLVFAAAVIMLPFAGLFEGIYPFVVGAIIATSVFELPGRRSRGS